MKNLLTPFRSLTTALTLGLTLALTFVQAAPADTDESGEVQDQIETSFHSSKTSRERKLYAGTNSTEAIVKFDFFVEVNKSKKPSRKYLLEKIEFQLAHIFGPGTTAKYKAVTKGDHKITFSTKKLKKREAGVWQQPYHYTGTFVIENGPKSKYSIKLPYNPDTIYGKSMVEEGIVIYDPYHPTVKQTVYFPCTDLHYQDEGDFWYFWDPRQTVTDVDSDKTIKCPLRKGGTGLEDAANHDYAIVQTKITRKKNTTNTFPEYHNLEHDINGERVIEVINVFGLDDPSNGKDPNTSKDDNAKSYRKVKDWFLDQGYQLRKWTRSDIEAIVPVSLGTAPIVETLTKKGDQATLSMTLFFGETGINEDSTHFHYFLKYALENASVFIYDGHSGLGGHLDLDSIEYLQEFDLNFSDKYQIMFFNSCSSYPYYNTQYFARKANSKDKLGHKKLDILTNGLATIFGTKANNALNQALHNWAMGKSKTSYSQLAKGMEDGNLFGVNGDEDNEAPQWAE